MRDETSRIREGGRGKWEELGIAKHQNIYYYGYMTIQSHKDLKVWQKSMKMVELVYLAARKFPREEIYGLTAQLKRAAISVPANIAEGNARASRKDYAHFLSIARGSLTEAETLLLLAKQLRFVSATEIEPVMGQIDGISRMLKTMRSRILAPEAK